MDKLLRKLSRISESDPDNIYHRLNHLRLLARLGEVFLFEEKDKVIEEKDFGKKIYIYADNVKFQKYRFTINYMYIHDSMKVPCY
jgi:hypothetical protein